MNDDNHETRDEYEDRKEQHEAASEIDAFRASCTHIHVIYRPVGGNAEGWLPVWVCERCCAKFVPETQVNMAFRAAAHPEAAVGDCAGVGWDGCRTCLRKGNRDV